MKKFKIIDDANCNFCQKENKTIEHIFWGCENVQNLLGQVNSWFGDKDINQTFLKKTLIFGDVDKVYKDDVHCIQCHFTKHKILYIYKQMSEEKIIHSFA